MKVWFFSLFLITLSLHSALAGEQKNFEVAGMQLAIAANCRASYGEDDLFEIAFTNFENLARGSGHNITDEELAKAKQKLYETEAETGDNPFLRGFCKELKEKLLPVSVFAD